MIKFHARKPVRDFLNKVTEPPYSLPIDEHNQCFESILERYEESTNKERQNFLCTDVFDLLRAFIEEDKAINRKDPKDTHRYSASEISLMLSGLIAAANQYGVRLPESEIKRYEKVDFGICSFAQFVRDIYQPIEPIQAKKEIAPIPANDINQQAAPADTSKPATDGGNTPPPPEKDDDPNNIFNACIIDEYRQHAKTIRKGLEVALKGKQTAYIVKTFAACCLEPHAILKKCPTYKEAQEINNQTIGISQGYNARKREIFEKDDNGIYTEPKESFWNDESVFVQQIVKQLKPIFGMLCIKIKGI